MIPDLVKALIWLLLGVNLGVIPPDDTVNMVEVNGVWVPEDRVKGVDKYV